MKRISLLLIVVIVGACAVVARAQFGGGGLVIQNPIANSPITFVNPNGTIFQLSGAPNPVTWVVCTSEIHPNPGCFGHGTAAYPDPGMNILTDCATDYKPVDIIGGNEGGSDWAHFIGPCGASNPLVVKAAPAGAGPISVYDRDGKGMLLGSSATKVLHNWFEGVTTVPGVTIPPQSMSLASVTVGGGGQNNVSFCSPVGGDPGAVVWSSRSPAANTVEIKIWNPSSVAVTIPTMSWACDVVN